MSQTNAIPLLLGKSEAGSVVILVLILMGVVIIGGFVLMHVRRKLLGQETTELASEGLFDSLRRMRDSGEISTTEYDAARKRIIERVSETKPTPVRQTTAQAEILSAARRAQFEREHASQKQAERRAQQQLAPPGYDLTGDPLPSPKPRAHD